MSATSSLNLALLRPAIIQILRAVGFHSAKPSVVDTLTDISARYMALLASRTMAWAQENHNSNVPDVTDVRMALTDCGMLMPTTQGSEEVWREILRQPLEEIPDRNGLRMIEAARRDEEDTEDVQAFVAWFTSSICEEIKRISGHATSDKADTNPEMDDYLTGKFLIATEEKAYEVVAVKKKHSKTGEESRFQGTILGVNASSKAVKIDGGPASINEWIALVKEKATAESVDAISEDVKMDDG